MKASVTLRDHSKNPIFKAKIPISICGLPFRSGIDAADFEELCISFSTAFCSGPRLNFCYRPNDSTRPFGLSVRTGIGHCGSPFGSPISITAEFSFVGGNFRPRFLLHFKPRFGDFSVQRSVESPTMIQSGGIAEEKLNLSWNQLLSSAYGALSDGEVRARTSVPVNRAVLKLGWSMKLPPPVSAEEGGDGRGWRDAKLLKELPYLVLRKIGIQREAGEEPGKGKRRESRGKGDDVVAERRFDPMREELDLLKSDKKEDLALAHAHSKMVVDG